MRPEEMSITITEIDTVPYLGMPECKLCQKRESEVIEQRISTNTGETIFDTHLQCRKLKFCKHIKEQWMAQTQSQIINGNGNEPVGFLRAEQLTDERAVCVRQAANQNTHILGLQKEIEMLRGQLPRWIPVTERLPEYGVRVLATDMYEGDDYTEIRTREEYPDDADGCWYNEWGRWYAIDDATHWMPLPKTPEVKRNE